MTEAELQAAKKAFRAHWLAKATKPERAKLHLVCPHKALCMTCPIEWPNKIYKQNKCPCFSSLRGKEGLVWLYGAAIESGNLAKASKIAQEIAGLEWRECK